MSLHTFLSQSADLVSECCLIEKSQEKGAKEDREGKRFIYSFALKIKTISAVSVTT